MDREVTFTFSTYDEFNKVDLTNNLIDKILSKDLRYHSAKKLAGNYYITILGEEDDFNRAKILIESLPYFKEFIKAEPSEEGVGESLTRKDEDRGVANENWEDNGYKQHVWVLLKEGEYVDSAEENYTISRPNSNRLLSMIGDDVIDTKTLAEELISRLSDDEIGRFAKEYGYFPDPGEELDAEEAGKKAIAQGYTKYPKVRIN